MQEVTLRTCTTTSACWSRSKEEREVFHHFFWMYPFFKIVRTAAGRTYTATTHTDDTSLHRSECLTNCGRRLGATPQRGATATPNRLNAMILSRIGQRSAWQTSSSFTPNGQENKQTAVHAKERKQRPPWLGEGYATHQHPLQTNTLRKLYPTVHFHIVPKQTTRTL